MSLALKLMLSPLLVTQAVMTRARLPRLPEPEGPRSGVTGQGGPLRLLICGDSSAAGVGVVTQRLALAQQLAKRVANSAPSRAMVCRICSRCGPRISCLASRTAPGGKLLKRSAMRRAWLATSPAGSTALAIPHSTACSGVKGSPSSSFSAARRWPISCGTTRLDANSGTRPSATKGIASRASSLT